MKKIPTLFERIYENHRVVGITPNVTPGCEALLKDIDQLYLRGKLTLKETINGIPAAEVRPVRHGRWVTREVLVNPIDGIWRTLVECSECGGEAFKHEAYGYQRDNFCHLCGADMRKEANK